MADTAVATNGDNPPAPVAGAAQQQPQSAWSQISGMVTRMFLFWMLISWLRGPNKQQQTATDGGVKARPAFNLLGEGNRFSLWVFVNEDATFHQYTPDVMQHLLWHQDELMYGAWTDGPEGDGSYSFTSTLDLSENVQNNGSLYMHTFLTRSGHVPFPNMEGEHDATFVVYRSKQLNRFKRRTIKKTQNLLTGETKTDRALLEHAEKHGPIEIVSHWHPNISVNLLVDHTNWVKGNVPAPLDQMINFDATGARYQPVLYLNDYWNLLREMTPINSTVKQVQLRITYQPISLFKLQMYVSQNMRNQWFSFMGDEYAQDSEEDQDALKEAILETNPYMLGLTVIVSIVHSIFEFLAFKNDIQFWKSRKSLEGLSVRSIVFSVLQSVIVLLYVMDNDTNFVIRVSIFIGCLIDAWKITKVMSVSLDRENRIFGLIPRPRFEDKSTYVESDTKKYDQLAFKYLGWLLFPLLVAYACYSLMYEEHKGVYSFVLGMLYGFLLTFGFIMMTPQLFINYKLKSVAHLPWRMLTYKALNTFIDDIFAFVIKMPTMYRIGCFRDDIVFFIYLYQRYKYRVDPTRLNEFGTSGVAPADDDAATGAAAPIDDTSAAQDKKND